jgi:prepilin-type N-terminal cleavage/methylation domain-containing protein
MTTLARLRRLFSDRRGMTIVEIMVAIAIMSVGLAALSSAIPIAAYGIQEGNQLSTATFLANQRLEQARNATWSASTVPACDNLGVSAPSTTAPTSSTSGSLCVATNTTFPDENIGASPPCTFTPVSGSGCYTRTVRITDCSVAPGCSGIVDLSLRQVTVTVSYRPMTGIGVAAAATTKSAVVTMYVAQR